MMENAISLLLSIDEQARQKSLDVGSKRFSDLLQNTTEVLSNINPAQVEALASSLSQHPPGQYFFVWISLLDAEANLPNLDLAAFARRVRSFITTCERDFVPYAPQKFSNIVRKFTERMVAAGTPMAAINVLKVALSKLAITPEHLTPVHAQLMKVCLLSKNYKAALPTLERDILEVDPQRTAVQPLDSLLYFYYGGMVWIGLKQFRRAQEFFILAISSPATTTSAVVVEAHKKFILVSLMLDGMVAPLPKFTSGAVLRQLKVHNAPYLDFASSYSSLDHEVLSKTFEKLLPNLQRDNNVGLAQQVLRSVYKRRILRLTQTYVTLSLADIASTAKLPGPKDAEQFVREMIQEGQIHAKISQKDSMVSFFENPEQYNTNTMMGFLDKQMQVTMGLGNRIEELQKRIMLSPSYIHKVVQSEKPAQFDEPEYDLPERHQGGMQVQ